MTSVRFFWRPDVDGAVSVRLLDRLRALSYRLRQFVVTERVSRVDVTNMNPKSSR